MSRSELIAELERLAHVFENHPIHSDMSNTLRATIHQMNVDAGVIYYLTDTKPSPPSSGPLPRVPGDK